MQEKKNDKQALLRTTRLLQIVQELRINPYQELSAIWQKFAISKSQFYKDKKALELLGFRFRYSKSKGFVIEEDKLSPIVDLSLSDRFFLMFALENLSSLNNGQLSAMAIEVGRKLSSGLESPFKEQLVQCFDRQVLQSGYGVEQEILAILRDAILQGERVQIQYLRSGSWESSWREIEPRRIYLRERVMYMYARTVDETPPQWKVFRISRIQDIKRTGIKRANILSDDDDFEKKISNSFLVYMGKETKKITIRFRNETIPYILERNWHSSQKIIYESENSILWSIDVAVPEEVVRWSRQYGENAEVVSIE